MLYLKPLGQRGVGQEFRWGFTEAHRDDLERVGRLRPVFARKRLGPITAAGSEVRVWRDLTMRSETEWE